MPEKTCVMISSTARDLPEHRKEVMDACLRQGMFPKMMEHLPASDADAIEASLRMVDEADIYLGVFAHRYGYVPKGHDISITEMEYNRAVERGIPCLIFFMDKSHPITAADMDEDTSAPVEIARRKVKLAELKDRAGKERVANFFKSPADLRAHVINSLSQHRQPDLTAFHYVSDIPAPPEAYIAHPYTLLQTHRLIGRQAELNLLTDWVTGQPWHGDTGATVVRILNIVAIGGMGKSALTWKWFNDIAPQELKPLAGRMWWSFYESDATFENFVIRALAYVTRRAKEDIEKNVKPGEREEQLLAALDREPYLVVLDGLERILIAYARMDAARLADDDIQNHLPLRKTADPRVGAFLRRLAGVRASRILVSTRLLPADLEDRHTGDLLPGVSAISLHGLSDDDALDLWRASGVSGSRDALLPLFRAFENHPLVIKALAGEVKSFRPAPGDFEKWRARHSDFDPRKLARVQETMGHVLEFALRGLSASDQQVLKIVAAFRMPAAYDTLAAVLVGNLPPPQPSPVRTEREQERERTLNPPAGKGKVFPNERILDAALYDLEERGLLGWDRRANRYDLHPIVRGVVWNGLEENTRRDIYGTLRTHFEALPMIDDWHQVNSLQDLTSAIELYNTLIGLGRYEDAYVVFRDRINKAALYRLSASRQRAELIEALFPDGLEQLPRLSKPGGQAFTLNALAAAYHFGGQPGRAAPLLRRHNDVRAKEHDEKNLSAGLCNLSYALRLAGDLHEAEATARRALVLTREQSNRFLEAVSLYWLGLALAARGIARESESALRQSLRMFIAQSDTQSEGVVNSYLAQRALWLGQAAEALPLADRAWELAHSERCEADFIQAARRQGAAALGLGDPSTPLKASFAQADERLHHALTRARAVNLVEEELPALIALAELRRRQGNLEAARELLDDAWELAERGPYPLDHADAYNVLAQIERDAGNPAVAVEAATKAYRLAWCDGEPFAYHWGLVAARKHLAELGAPEPPMPPFDGSKYEPMPEVEINPHDEFYVEENET